MAILEILHYPNNLLRQKGLDVEIFDESLEIIIKNMLETMYSAKGIGLAAIQVNIIKNIIVIDISEKRNEPVVLINPVITRKEEKIAQCINDIIDCMIKVLEKLKPYKK